MQYAAKVLSRPKSTVLFDAMEFLSRPLEKRFNDELRLAKTKSGTLAWMQGLSAGDFASTLVDIMSGLTSKEFGAIVGFSENPGQASLKLNFSLTIGRVMWRFTHSLIGSLAVSNCKYLIPPRSFIGLTNKDASIQQACMDDLKATFSSLTALETIVHDSDDAAHWVRNLEWPSQVWCRENFVYLAECEFMVDKMYPWLKEELEGYGMGFNTSLLIENMFNHARKISKLNPRHRMEARSMWHAVCLGSGLPKDYDRPNMPVT